MLLGMELIQEVVQSVLFTSQLTTDTPISLMLIAKPESGKTSIVLTESSEEAVICSDLTGGGITQELMNNNKVGHLIINDMVSVMAHKEVVNKRTFAIMNAMTEEGLYKIALPGTGYYDFKGKKVGVICCIPEEMVRDKRRWWNSSGFSSRFLPFAYKYSKSLIVHIKRENLETGAYERRNGHQKIENSTRKHEKHLVLISAEMAHKIQIVADHVAKNMEEIGLRRGKQMRALARGHALLQKRKSVSQADIDFLNEASRYMEYQVEEELEAPKKEK
jgi:hypothetical protein